MPPRIRVGIVDSGVAPELRRRVVAARRFTLDGGNAEVVGVPGEADGIGHGNHVSRILAAHAADAVLLDAQVFADKATTTPAAVAAAIDWLVGQHAQIVNLSLGLRSDRAVLRHACQAAVSRGLLLVAAAPARGAPVYPSAYPQVLRVTGDARCGATQFSHLASDQAEFGACPRGHEVEHGIGGASFAVPYVCAALASHPAAAGSPESARDHLIAIASYRGPERRSR